VHNFILYPSTFSTRYLYLYYSITVLGLSRNESMSTVKHSMINCNHKLYTMIFVIVKEINEKKIPPVI